MIKYVRLKKNDAIIIFPDFLEHCEIARVEEVVSAGFVDVRNWTCAGKSISLKKKSNPVEDTILLRILLTV